MTELFKKSFNIVKDTPFITLYFVIYLIVLFLILPVILLGENQVITYILLLLLMLLTCAFLAGWFGMIKTSVTQYSNEEKTPETKIKELVNLKNSFFASVSTYILPVIAGMIILLLCLWGFTRLSNILYGGLDEVFKNLAPYANDTEALKEHLLALPNSTWIMIFKKGMFSYLSYSLTALAGVFWAASLYLNKKGSLNPILAIWNSILTIFSKFFESVVIFLMIIVINFVLMLFQGLFIDNIIISFIVMILRIYFTAFIIVLIFDLYEKNAKKMPCCNNGPDGVGQDETCDKSGEEN